MKKHLSIFLAAVAVLGLLAGCRSTSAETEKKAAEALLADDQAAASAFALEKGNLMLEAMRDGDYEKFMSPLRSEAQAKYTLDFFTKMREQLGKIEQTEYLSELRSQMLYTYLWKVSCRRTGGAEATEGQPLHFDLLFTLVVGKVDGEYVVFGFRFI